jgi:hypothetical protein
LKITLIGTSTDGKGDDVEMSIQYQETDLWRIKVGKVEFDVTDLEKSMAFLKEDANKEEVI